MSEGVVFNVYWNILLEVMNGIIDLVDVYYCKDGKLIIDMKIVELNGGGGLDVSKFNFVYFENCDLCLYSILFVFGMFWNGKGGIDILVLNLYVNVYGGVVVFLFIVYVYKYFDFMDIFNFWDNG